MHPDYSELTRQTYTLLKAYTELSELPSADDTIRRIVLDLTLKFHVRGLLETVQVQPGSAYKSWSPKFDFLVRPLQAAQECAAKVRGQISFLHFEEWGPVFEQTIAPVMDDFERTHGTFARNHLQELHKYVSYNILPGGVKRRTQQILNRLHMETLPQLDMSKVKNIVLAGGGAKTMSLAGCLQALSEDPRVSLHRVAGTSGGAILAMAFAVGMSSEEIRSLILENNFGIFTLDSRADNPLMNLFVQYKAKNDPTHVLHAATDLPFYKEYHQKMCALLADFLGDEQRGGAVAGASMALTALQSKEDYAYTTVVTHLNRHVALSVMQEIEKEAKRYALDRCGITAEDPRWTVPAYPSPKQAVVFALRHRFGHDLIREFLADVVESRLLKVMKEKPFLLQTVFGAVDGSGHVTMPKGPALREKFRAITFNQLHQLHQLSMIDFKELHVSMSVRRHLIDRLSKDVWRAYRLVDASHEDPVFGDLPIVEAVRVSMNLPGVYPEYKFTLSGVLYGGVDGGLLSNLSMDTFDTQKSIEPNLFHAETSFQEQVRNKYRKMDTIGIFYKTSQELRKTPHFSNILASNKQIHELEAEFREIESEIEKLKLFVDVSYATPAMVDRAQISLARKQGKAAAIALEIANKTEARERMFSPSALMDRYLQKKNDEYGHRSIDVRRLIMVNTKKVDTAHFKLSSDVKEEQFRQGYAACQHFLSNHYCLENAFYAQKLSAITPDAQTLLCKYEKFPEVKDENELSGPALGWPGGQQKN